jgi:8-oxo-dGTP pyrophosphatase MutT (NUDIX family)
MENNETTAQAAERETMEEAGARIEMQALFSLLNVAHVSIVSSKILSLYKINDKIIL